MANPTLCSCPIHEAPHDPTMRCMDAVTEELGKSEEKLLRIAGVFNGWANGDAETVEAIEKIGEILGEPF